MIASVASLLALAATGCLPPNDPPVYRVDQRYVLDPDIAEMHAHPDAPAALAAATTVAVLPPDGCRADVEIEVDAPESPAALVCESAIARLEAAALDVGYEVVSWRALTGGDDVRARAAAAGVDLLFVVDELTAGVPGHELYSASSTTVVDFADERVLSLEHPDVVGARCAAALAETLAPEVAVVLDAQLVAVDDGRVLWTYRRVQHAAAGTREARASRRYRARVGPRPEGVADWKIVTGALGISLGAPSLLATSIVDATGAADPPTQAYAAELALLAFGIYGLATANADAHWRYSPPDEVVCLPDRFPVPGDRPVSAWPVCDGRCRRALVQVDAAVDDLFTQLARLREPLAGR